MSRRSLVQGARPALGGGVWDLYSTAMPTAEQYGNRIVHVGEGQDETTIVAGITAAAALKTGTQRALVIVHPGIYDEEPSQPGWGGRVDGVGLTGNPLDVNVPDGMNHSGNGYLAGMSINADVVGSGYSMHNTAQGVSIFERLEMNNGLGVDCGPNSMSYYIDIDLTYDGDEAFTNLHGGIAHTQPSRVAFVRVNAPMLRLGYHADSTQPDELWIVDCTAPSWYSDGVNLDVHVDGAIPPYAGNVYGSLTTSDDLPPMPIHGHI